METNSCDPFSPEYQKALRKEWAEEPSIKLHRLLKILNAWTVNAEPRTEWDLTQLYARPADVLGEREE